MSINSSAIKARVSNVWSSRKKSRTLPNYIFACILTSIIFLIVFSTQTEIRFYIDFPIVQVLYMLVAPLSIAAYLSAGSVSWPPIIMTCWAVYSLFWSQFFSDGFEQIVFISSAFLYWFFVLNINRNADSVILPIVKSFVISSFLYLMYCLFFFDSYIDYRSGVFVGPIQNRHNFGSLLCVFLVFCISVFYFNVSRLYYVFAFIAVVLIFYFSYVSFARSFYIFSFMYFGILSFIKLGRIKTSLYIFLVFALVLIFSDSLLEPLFSYSADKGLSGRDDIIFAQINFLKEHGLEAFLFGLGAGSNVGLSNIIIPFSPGGSMNDSGIFIIMIFVYGIFGLLLYLFFIFSIIKKLLRISPKYLYLGLLAPVFLLTPTDAHLFGSNSIELFVISFSAVLTYKLNRPFCES